MNKIIISFVCLASCFALIQCDKENVTKTGNQDPVSAYQYQLVELGFNDDVLEKDQYNARINDLGLLLDRSGNNTLSFITPFLKSGVYEMIIPELNDYTIKLTILETTLSASVEETLYNIDTLFTGISVNIEGQVAEDSTLLKASDSYLSLMENASDSVKMDLALFYTANKILIDEMLFSEQSELKFACLFCPSSTAKFNVAALAFSAGVVVAWKAPTLETKLFGGAIATVAWYKMNQYYNQIAFEERVKIFEFILGDLSDELDELSHVKKAATTRFTFINNSDRRFQVYSLNRTLIQSDINDNTNTEEFFAAFGLYNTAITKLNNVIEFVNENIFFASMDQVANVSMQESSDIISFSAAQNTILKIEFSIDNPGISISDPRFYQSGKISAIISADESLFTTGPLDANLVIRYTDDFNEIEQAIPISILNGDDQLMDIDGNIYNTVKIGNQIWMAENLKTETYNNGSEIYYSTTVSIDAYFAYPENNKAYSDVYGNLYNYAAVNTGRLSPENWHVPSESEWDILIDYLGGAEMAATALKLSGPDHWAGTGTNSSGFSALAPGFKDLYQWYNVETSSRFWSSTIESAYGVWSYQITSSAKVYKEYWYGGGLYSIRCIKD